MKTKINSKTIIIGLIIVIIIGALSVPLIRNYQKKKNYEDAVSHFKKQVYAGAKDSFEKAGNYQSGDKLALICDVFDNLKNGQYSKAADLTVRYRDYSVEDSDMQADINEKLESFYQQAQTMAQAGDPLNAYYILHCLKDYKDSAQAASYYHGIYYMNEHNLERAASQFEETGDYQDAAALAKNCRDYLTADELDKNGDKVEAGRIFNTLGDFRDAQERGAPYRNFNEAKAKADAGDYEGAYNILSKNYNNNYPGWSELLTQCKNDSEYKKAREQYKKKHYYKAYVIYKSLGNYKNSAKNMKKCVKKTPSDTILYQDPDYKSSAVSLTFKNNGNRHNYIKMYNSKDKLIATLFVKRGSSGTIHIPSGTYHINKGYGDTWFGEKDMFGDEGYYSRCKVNGNYDFSLKSGYAYTMSSDQGSGDAVSGVGVGADQF